jgi:hypothetical protein
VWIGSGPGARPLAVIAVGASLIRVGCSLVAVRRTVALRRRLAARADPDAGR